MVYIIYIYSNSKLFKGTFHTHEWYVCIHIKRYVLDFTCTFESDIDSYEILIKHSEIGYIAMLIRKQAPL